MYERTNILLIAFNSILKKNLSYTFRSNDSNHKLVRQVNFLVSYYFLALIGDQGIHRCDR